MSDKPAKTEKLPIDSTHANGKTERMDLPATHTTRTERIEVPDHSIETKGPIEGSLHPGEPVAGCTVEALLAAHTGEAEIYTALRGEERVVIKYYHLNFTPNREVLEQLRNLDHPDIIRLYEFETYRSRFLEVMEYAAGGTLGDRNEDDSYRYLPMGELDAIEILKEVASSLLYIHERGIIHRDIKPGNLFYRNEDGSDLMIGDFGISSQLNVAEGKSKRMTSKIALSEGYAAPELYGIARVEGEAKILIGPEVDYYALGMTLYEIITGTSPFREKNPLHIMRDTIEGLVADDILGRKEASHLSNRMKELLRGLLTVRHDKRWGYDEVNRWLSGEKVEVFVDAALFSKGAVQTAGSEKSPGRDGATPPLRFGKETIVSIPQFVSAMQSDRENARKYLMRGMLEDWARKFDASLMNLILDAKEFQGNDDQKVIYLLSHLDPNIPLRLNKKVSIFNQSDLVSLVSTEPKALADIIENLDKSYFLPWAESHYPGFLERYRKVMQENQEKLAQDRLEPWWLLIFSLDHRIRPFSGSSFEIASKKDLTQLPETLREEAIEQLQDRSSLLFQWIIFQQVPQFEERWKRVDSSWENLVDLLKGRFSQENGDLRTRHQVSMDQERGNLGDWFPEFLQAFLSSKKNDIKISMIDFFYKLYKSNLSGEVNGSQSVGFMVAFVSFIIFFIFTVLIFGESSVMERRFNLHISILSMLGMIYSSNVFFKMNTLTEEQNSKRLLLYDNFVTFFIGYVLLYPTLLPAGASYDDGLAFGVVFSFELFLLPLLLLVESQKRTAMNSYASVFDLDDLKKNYTGPERFAEILARALQGYLTNEEKEHLLWDLPSESLDSNPQNPETFICALTSDSRQNFLAFQTDGVASYAKGRRVKLYPYDKLQNPTSLPEVVRDFPGPRVELAFKLAAVIQMVLPYEHHPERLSEYKRDPEFFLAEGSEVAAS